MSKKVLNLETETIYESGTQAKDELNLKSEYGIYIVHVKENVTRIWV